MKLINNRNYLIVILLLYCFVLYPNTACADEISGGMFIAIIFGFLWPINFLITGFFTLNFYLSEKFKLGHCFALQCIIAAIMSAFILKNSVPDILFGSRLFAFFFIYGSILQLISIVALVIYKKKSREIGEIKDIRPAWEEEDKDDPN